MKRVAVVISSVLFFRVSDMQSAPDCNLINLFDAQPPNQGGPAVQNPVSPLNWAGSALAILGTYLYSIASQKAKSA
jgi:hypothetical protein